MEGVPGAPYPRQPEMGFWVIWHPGATSQNPILGWGHLGAKVQPGPAKDTSYLEYDSYIIL